MKRTLFGDPRPKGIDQLWDAIGEVFEHPNELSARVGLNEETEGDYAGFGAEIVDADGTELITCGYETKDALLDDLKAAGITDIEEW